LTCSRRWRKARVPAGDLALISLPAAAAGDALRRDGLPGGNIRSDGLPLLQPLPLRWSGRPRGLRIVNIVTIVDTVIVRIVNNISIVKPPVVASLRPWQASGCGTMLCTSRVLAPGAAPRRLRINTFGMFIGTDNTFGIFIGTYTYGVFIGTQHHRAAAMAALFPVGELARPLLRYAIVPAAVAVLP
jgi:hypothetical protein